jgi:simple sugar transport system permease protein
VTAAPRDGLGSTAGRVLWPLVALGLLLLFNLLFTDRFFVLELRDGRLYGTLVDILDRSAPLVLLSLGMAMVIATGGVDLSVGAVMAISGALAAGLVARPEYSVLAAVPGGSSTGLAVTVALGAALLAGAGNGLIVTRFGVQPIVATLVLMVAGRGVAQLLTNGQIVTFDDAGLAFLGSGQVLGLPAAVVVTSAIGLALLLVVRLTALGLFVEAVGESPAAARACGLRSGAIRCSAYAVCGVLAGVAGLLAASDIRAADANSCGLYAELDAILAVVIGGTALTGGRFCLLGAVVGALLIQSVTTTILSRGVPVEHTLIVKAGIVIAVCLLQSPRFRSRALRAVPRRRRERPA